MIVTGVDERNYQVVIDGLQAKMLVELCEEMLRDPIAMIPKYVAVAERVNLDGFEMIASDVMAAAMSVQSVLGYFTRMVKSVKKLKEEEEPKVEPSTDEAEEALKPVLM